MYFIRIFTYYKLLNKVKMKGKKRIDKVTVERLDDVLKLIGININEKVVDNIICAVELIEDKGGKVTLNDIENLKRTIKRPNKPIRYTPGKSTIVVSSLN